MLTGSFTQTVNNLFSHLDYANTSIQKNYVKNVIWATCIDLLEVSLSNSRFA